MPVTFAYACLGAVHMGIMIWLALTGVEKPILVLSAVMGYGFILMGLSVWEYLHG